MRIRTVSKIYIERLKDEYARKRLSIEQLSVRYKVAPIEVLRLVI